MSSKATEPLHLVPPTPQYARAGSQRWLQMLIEERPDLLLQTLRQPLQLPDSATIDWVSPRAADGFCEYRDMEALGKLGIDALPVRSLKEFWPARGPVWDALGKTSTGEYIFLEAKANIPEAASPPSRANPASLAQIRRSLEEARRFYAPRATSDWTGTFYQYANRLAHHYFFREVNRLPSHLVFLYFINADDVDGPKTELEWKGAIHLLHTCLGLGKMINRAGVHEVFVDAKELR